MEDVIIVYCCNKKMEPPLCVSAYAALMHVSARAILRFIVFTDENMPIDLMNLQQVLNKCDRDYRLEVIPVDISRYRYLSSLRDDHSPYLKMLFPEMLDRISRVIYLDADTLPLLDLSDLFYWNLDGCVVAAASHEKIKLSQQREFFYRQGLDGEDYNYNSGVLVIDIDKWKISSYTKKLIDFSVDHHNEYSGVDQAVINVIMRGDIKKLPMKYNIRIGPSTNIWPKGQPGLLHFVGSSKPWDPYANLYHNNYYRYYEIAKEAGLRCILDFDYHFSLSNIKYLIKGLYRRMK